MRRFLCLLAIVGGLASPVAAQVVTLDAAGTQATATGATSSTYTGLTVGVGSNRALTVAISWDADPGAISVARWDDGASNQDVTLIRSVTTANGQICHLYGLVAPTSGNKTLQFTWQFIREYAINAVAWTGADQTGSTTTFANSSTATGNNASATITITLPTNGAGMSCVTAGSAASISSVSATQLLLVHGVGAWESGGSRSTSSGTFTGTLSGTDQWGITATGVAPVSAAGVTPRLLLLGVGGGQ